jgi:hypothetical protein
MKRMDSWGWVPVMPTHLVVPAEMRHLGIGSARRQYAADLQAFRVGAKAARALGDLLNLCRREKIRAALVLMPEGPAFRSWYSPSAEAQLQGLLAAVRQAYPVGLFDARDWIPEEGFLDSHHLLPDGATRFSTRFAGEVLALWAGGTAGDSAAGAGAAGLARSPKIANFPAGADRAP